MKKKAWHASGRKGRVFFILCFCLLLFGNGYHGVDEQKKSRAVYNALQKNRAHLFEVVTVFDGDTIQVKGLDRIFKIRLIGIDCPEMGFNSQKGQPFSQTAKHYLVHLIDHHRVRIKPFGTDTYNRQLAEVFADHKNLNLEMIKAGLAEVYSGKLPEALDWPRYLEAEKRARNKEMGMWTQGRSYKSPRQWRRENPRK